MTDQEKRIAIAEACGWKHRLATRESPCERNGMRLPNFFGEPIEAFWHKDIKGVFARPPDYLHDLNAMHSSVISRHMDWRMAFQNNLQRRAVETRRIIVELEACDHAECFLQTEREWRKPPPSTVGKLKDY